MKNLILILLLIPTVAIAQNEKVDNQFVPFIGKWENSTTDYEIKVVITHEPSFPLDKLAGLSKGETEVLFFDFFYFDKATRRAVIIESSLENPRALTAFLSNDQMPNVLVVYDNQAYRYKLRTINEDKIELKLKENPKYEVDVASKESRIIPKEPSPLPKEILLKRLKD